MIGIGQVFQERSAGPPGVRSHLSEPDSGFHRLHLAEERSDVTERVLPPMLEQPGRFGRDLPLVWLGQASPLVDLLPKRINHDGRLFILLGRRREPLAFVEHELLLGGGPGALAGFRNGCDEGGAAAALEHLLGRLPLLIKLPVPHRAGIGRVQDRMVKKGIAHVSCFSSPQCRRQIPSACTSRERGFRKHLPLNMDVHAPRLSVRAVFGYWRGRVAESSDGSSLVLMYAQGPRVSI